MSKEADSALIDNQSKNSSDQEENPALRGLADATLCTNIKDNIIYVSRSECVNVILNETENAWKSTQLTNNVEVSSEEQAKTAVLYKKVRRILNKLTPQKFNTLLSQFRCLDIDNIERLKGVVDIFYEKAVDQTKYALMYASFRKEVSSVVEFLGDPKEKGGVEEFITFGKLLITRCQEELEKKHVDQIVRNKKLKGIEECADPEKKMELKRLLEEDKQRDRYKSVGNIKLIGELFKEGFVKSTFIYMCLSKLLETLEEESLECLSKLLITTGKHLDSEKEDIEPFFVKIQNIVDTKRDEISNRVRFLLQDVIELRNNKWVPRRQESYPKTFDQIQKDLESEEIAIQISMSQRRHNQNSRRSNRMGGGNRRNWGKQTGEQRSRSVPREENRSLVDESHNLESTKPVGRNNIPK